MSALQMRYAAAPPSSYHLGQRLSSASAAEVRSNAIATLKRGASLNRTSEGRRPTQDVQPTPSQAERTTRDEESGGPSYLSIYPSQYGDEEVLSPSPIAGTFNHSTFSPPSATAGIHRSASSSSFQIPTPPHLKYGQSSGSQYVSTTPSPSATADWSTVQTGQLYPAHPGNTPVLGRNTPSPLPTLGELRTLQRSNSDAARAKAMSKLTGGRETPLDDNHTLHASSSRPNLQRADSLDTPKVSGLAASRMTRIRPADLRSAEVRPMLQRSFTVSSSNMGEERRSAVARRMVERLAESRSTRKLEDGKVRQLWEERREIQHNNGLSRDVSGKEAADVPRVQMTEPVEPSHLYVSDATNGDMLAAPDRTMSRNTMRSGEEAFEYEAHLRRSLSSRTARGAVGSQPDPATGGQTQTRPDAGIEQVQNGRKSIHEQLHLEEPLAAPRPAFATPARHAPQSSTSTNSTARENSSPSSESTMSRDALRSMMFIMADGSSASPAGEGQANATWPMEVEENGASDWGTPAKGLQHAAFTDSPLVHNAPGLLQTHTMTEHLPNNTSDDGDSLTPPRGSERTSIMSWEEVGGSADQEVPMDNHYHKKSGSVSARIGRNIRTAMRKRSQSRSSMTSSIRTSSPPTSPNIIAAAIHGFSRRGSEASRASSAQQGEFIRKQPSINSLSPSAPGQRSSSQNTVLLQHQLSADPSPMAWMPRAELDDPRSHISKLSPLPEIADLERRVVNGFQSDHPPFLHQASDSVVPTQQRVTPAENSIYALPLPATSPIEAKRISDDNVGKRGWLAKAFGQQSQQTSQRPPAGTAWKSSNGEIAAAPSRINRKPSEEAPDSDPFAGPPLPSAKPTRHRSTSPAVSTVQEVSEEGSRLTRFTFATQRVDNASPLIDEDVPETNENHLPNESMDVLQRMDQLLALAPDDPAQPDILDDPPRKLLLATQILQVVNVHTAKDRFLFLFNDILVIAKPLITSGIIATLDMKYLVKSIVSLDRLSVSGFDAEPTTEPERHAVVQRFIEQFADNPVAACAYLVERSNPRVDSPSLASLIFKTSELDKTQIGLLLSSDDKLMRGVIERFHFAGIRIEEALRMFLLTLRLPTNPDECHALLEGFSQRYCDSNRVSLPFDQHLGLDLVMAIMQLNDSLFGMGGFALATTYVDQGVFVSAWRSKDPKYLVPDEQLDEIYSSVRQNPLAQALDPKLERELGRIVTVTPTRLPQKLFLNVWSEEIRISVPSPDSHFRIRLLGEGLDFDPPVLDFSHDAEVSFRVKGTSLGAKSILFDRFGKNAALYASLGNNRTFSVEKAYMAHTFHVSFLSHTGSKRRYCFSLNDAETRAKWGVALRRQIEASSVAKSRCPTTIRQKVWQAAEAVSLQVLRDAVIPPEEKVADPHVSRMNRRGSVSVAYPATAGRDEENVGPPSQPTQSGANGERMSGLMDVQTGKELVLLCRQNSLLPGLLEFLQAGVGPEVEAEHGKGMINGHEKTNGYEHGKVEKEFKRRESVKARVPGGMV